MGNFVPCTVPAGTTVRYGVGAPFVQRSAKAPEAPFAAAIEAGLRRAGWPVKQATGGGLATRRAGVQVLLKVFPPTGGMGATASLTVQTGCVNVGNAAQPILSHYGGAEGDDYRQQRPGTSPMPTGFPSSP
jgi:hypothetical protein